MSVFEVLCCINAVVWLLKKVFRGKTNYEIIKEDLLLKQLLTTLPKGRKKYYKLLISIDTIIDITSLIVLCKVISRFVGQIMFAGGLKF